MRKEADELLKILPVKLKAKADKQSQAIISLYYSVCNNEKDQILELMNSILGPKVIIHLSNPELETIYKEQIKKNI